MILHNRIEAKRAFLSEERDALFFSVRVRQNSQTTDFVSFANDFSAKNSQTIDFLSFLHLEAAFVYISDWPFHHCG